MTIQEIFDQIFSHNFQGEGVGMKDGSIIVKHEIQIVYMYLHRTYNNIIYYTLYLQFIYTKEIIYYYTYVLLACISSQ